MLVNLKEKSLGLLFCLLVGVLIHYLGLISQIPLMLIAILLGISMHSFIYNRDLQTGIDFTGNNVLKFAVGLIGLQLSIQDLAQLGLKSIFVLMLIVATTIFLGLVISKSLKLSQQFGLISSSAIAICGASAALAVTSVLPKNSKLARDTSVSIIIITLLSTLAMLVYPYLINWIIESDLGKSLFLGGSIHNVAHVVGAAYSLSDNIGEQAVLIKLIRVAFLIPVVFIIANFASTSASTTNRAKLPWFLTLFALLLIVNSVISIPETITSFFQKVSKFLLVTAMFAIGLKTNLKEIIEIGSKPILSMILLSLWVVLLLLVIIISFY